MGAGDHLSRQQFVDIPLSQINRVPIPHEDLMEDEWAMEHVEEYQEHGGSHGYVQHLANSMSVHGQDVAVELRRAEQDRYDIQDGNHRVAAAASAGLSHVKALVYG